MKKLRNYFKSYLQLFIVISILLIACSFIFPFLVNNYFNDWTQSGTFGDTFGALNAIFSALTFSGLIITLLIQREELSNQRTELVLQRQEMKDTRKEFLINRVTNLVYNQLERFEKNIENFSITHDETIYKGQNAIIFLYDNLNVTFRGVFDSHEEYLKAKKESVIANSVLLANNKSELNKFAHISYNSVKVLNDLLFSTDLEIEELDNLKKMFFRNIGFINLRVIERLSSLQSDQSETLQTEDYIDHDLDVGVFKKVEIFLEYVIEVYKTKLTEENFQELKEKAEKE